MSNGYFTHKKSTLNCMEMPLKASICFAVKKVWKQSITLSKNKHIWNKQTHILKRYNIGVSKLKVYRTFVLCFQVVLCSEPDLQSGFSRDLFVAWCGNPKNSIILTNRTSPRTLARWLIDHPDNKTVTMEVSVVI